MSVNVYKKMSTLLPVTLLVDLLFEGMLLGGRVVERVYVCL
jgi:hypothetical protein